MLQFCGLLAVLLTAVGCLYMMASSTSQSPSIASQAGLNADGILLLLLLNVAYVAWMLVLIVRAGKHELCEALKWVRARVCTARHALCQAPQGIRAKLASAKQCLTAMRPRRRRASGRAGPLNAMSSPGPPAACHDLAPASSNAALMDAAQQTADPSLSLSANMLQHRNA